MVEALSCSEAEVKITEEMQDSIIGEFEVRATRMSKIAEVWFGSGEDDRWYKAKVRFLCIDDKTGREKSSAVSYLVEASTIERAITCVNQKLSDTIIAFDLIGLVETRIIGVFTYPNKVEAEIENK